MHYPREVGGDILITVYHYSGGVSATRQVSTPVVEEITGGGYCLKANACTAPEEIENRVGRRNGLVYLYNTTIAWADIHGQRKTTTWSAS